MKHIALILAAFTFTLAAAAADAPAEPVADEAEVNPAAWEFLSAVNADDARRAYELITADYRAKCPPEAFGKEVERLRGSVDFKRLKRLQIFAAPPPADDRPRQAMATWPTSLSAAEKADRRAVTLVLHLSFEDGAWRVAGAALDEAGGYLRAFKDANGGVRPVASAGPGMMGVTGVVTKLDETSITVGPAAGWSGPRPPERAFALDAETRVFVPEYSRDQELPGGRVFPIYKAVPGKREDLKVGQRVQVEWGPKEQRAVRVSILRPDRAAGK